MRTDHGLTIHEIAKQYWVVDVQGNRVGPFNSMIDARDELRKRAYG